MLALDQSDEDAKPIDNPFDEFYDSSQAKNKSVILRSKKGNRSFEIELPEGNQTQTELIVPISPNLDSGTQKTGDLDYSYSKSRPGITDRQIATTFPQQTVGNQGLQTDIEKDLGLIPSDSGVPKSDHSYLAKIDHVKQLYKLRRFEASLIEIDRMLRQYPTNPKLYEMKGTLLEKLGYKDLAMQAWEESLELNPENRTLLQYVDRKKTKKLLRRPASK